MKKYFSLENISISLILMTFLSAIKVYMYWWNFNLNIFNYIEPGELLLSWAFTLLTIWTFFGFFLVTQDGNNSSIVMILSILSGGTIIGIVLYFSENEFSDFWGYNLWFLIILWSIFQFLKSIKISWWILKTVILIIALILIYTNNFIEHKIISKREIELKLIDNTITKTTQDLRLIWETKWYIFLQNKEDQSVEIINKANILIQTVR